MLAKMITAAIPPPNEGERQMSLPARCAVIIALCAFATLMLKMVEVARKD